MVWARFGCMSHNKAERILENSHRYNIRNHWRKSDRRLEGCEGWVIVGDLRVWMGVLRMGVWKSLSNADVNA